MPTTQQPNETPAIGDSAKRQYRSKQERLRIVEESFETGASVAVVARRHSVNANQIFHWRKLLRAGRLGAETTSAPLLPVRIAEVHNEADGPVRLYTGTIQMELGRARVRREGSVDPASLRLILEHLGR